MRSLVLFVFLILEFATFAALGDVEFESIADVWDYTSSYATDLISQQTPVLVLAIGMTVVLATAGIDLSVASTVALIACVMSCFAPTTRFWIAALPVGLCAGVGLGLFNGLLIGRIAVPPIIATLGTMMFYRGLCFVVMGDLERDPFYEVPGYDWFGGLSGALTILTVMLVACVVALRSRWRREILMLGGNRVAARYAAIPATRRTIEVYTLMGCLAFVAALCFTSRDGSVSASSWTGLELQVIAAVVLGGTRVEGGSGSLLGSVLGVLLIAVLNEGLREAAGWGQEHLPFKISYLRYVLIGGLLVVGVLLNTHLPATNSSGWWRAWTRKLAGRIVFRQTR